MEPLASLFCERPRNASNGSCDYVARNIRSAQTLRFLARLLPRKMAACASLIILLATPSSAQRAGRGSESGAPGWPITSRVPTQGAVTPDPTLSMQQPGTDPMEESCSLWTMAGTRRPTVSAATLHILGKAKSEYGKACRDLSQSKLASAEGHLRKAVQQYPEYADAWVLLGQVLGASNRSVEAGDACARALIFDSGYPPAYLCLADVAAQRKQWNQMLEMADRALTLAPAQDAYGYFYTAIAQFHLGQLLEAESNALRTIDADGFHRLPQVHVLLAQVYGEKHDLYNAAAQLRVYLKVAPNSPDSASVRKRLAELESQIPK
jgi:hypothetical protein